MKKILSLLILLVGLVAHNADAQNVISLCTQIPGNPNPSCQPVSSTAPMPVGVYGGSLATSGYILTSNGPGALASFKPAATSGTVSSASCVTANGVSCTVATATTTPALTFTLGNITPSNVSISSAVNTNAITITGNTDTASTKLLNITETWNNSGVSFDAPIFENITNTASAATSSIMDLQVGGSTQFRLSASGEADVNSNGLFGFINRGKIGSPANNTFTFNDASGGTQRDTLAVPASNVFQLGGLDASYATPQTLGVQNAAAGTAAQGGQFTIRGSASTGAGSGGSIVFQTTPSAASGTAQNTWVNVLSLTGGGGIIIGTSGLTWSSTPMTVSSGFGTSPSVGTGCTTASCDITVGSSSGPNGVIVLPTATNAWICDAQDLTTPSNVKETGRSLTVATFTNYSLTTGLPTSFTTGDVIMITCAGH